MASFDCPVVNKLQESVLVFKSKSDNREGCRILNEKVGGSSDTVLKELTVQHLVPCALLVVRIETGAGTLLNKDRSVMGNAYPY